MLKNFLSILLLLAPLSALFAETNVSFVCVATTAATDEFELVSNGKHSKPFSLPSNFISPKMSVSSRELSLVRAKNVEGTPPCNFQLPKSGKDFIAVISPTNDSFEAFVLPADDRSFKTGDVFIYNTSAHTIRGTIGTTAFKIEPGSGNTVRTKIEKGANEIEVEIFYIKDDKESPLSKTAWPIEANIRSYLFFFTGKHDHPDYRAVDEFVAPSR